MTVTVAHTPPLGQLLVVVMSTAVELRDDLEQSQVIFSKHDL